MTMEKFIINEGFFVVVVKCEDEERLGCVLAIYGNLSRDFHRLSILNRFCYSLKLNTGWVWEWNGMNEWNEIFADTLYYNSEGHKIDSNKLKHFILWTWWWKYSMTSVFLSQWKIGDVFFLVALKQPKTLAVLSSKRMVKNSWWMCRSQLSLFFAVFRVLYP